MINNVLIGDADSAAHNNQTRTHIIWIRSSLLKLIQIGDYPCLCLCFGFSQITLMRPFLLMILHLSQIGFTDDLTFTLNPPFKKDRFILYHRNSQSARVFPIYFSFISSASREIYEKIVLARIFP